MSDSEKLTETVGVKLSDRHMRQIRAVAESHGLETSSWIRSLIEDALAKEQARYLSLHSIFGQDNPETKSNVEKR